MIKYAAKLPLILFLHLHNLAYRLSTKFALYFEGGLHPKHRIMNYHQFFVDRIDKDDRVLDIGCGNGALTYDIAMKARHVVGVDIVPENIQRAKMSFSSINIDYHVGDATTMAFHQSFDVITLSNVLEHIEDRQAFLKSIRPKASRFLIRVPVIDRDWITLYKKELGVEWRLDKTHCVEYTFTSFEEELKGAELRIQYFQINFGEIWAVVC